MVDQLRILFLGGFVFLGSKVTQGSKKKKGHVCYAFSLFLLDRIGGFIPELDKQVSLDLE